ncbi:MAG: preprotein translocase subunit SecG [Opitutae bacterium]|jgi:protein translocase SecG subunit|nr:preprotein translocase subunit SecG [Opitutae bacterium]
MIVFLTTLLILLCLVVVLLIMIQRTSGGMGSALGGGAADQVLGAGSAAQLTKMTVWFILGYFILSFALYAFYQSEAGGSDNLQRLGTGTPVLQSDPLQAIPNPVGAADATSMPNPDEVPSPTPVDQTPVVNESAQEINSSK